MMGIPIPCLAIDGKPVLYLTATLTAIVNGHKQGQIHELLSWNNLPLERSNRQQ
ncbi:hypothetical protein ABIC60_004657 [Phyllobacterium ifriqiyense]